ncbi:hypothetical protein [Acetobacterium malicum]|uniref:hypothetical protein n=1 Tax=Acetobacterium malicum TaxID=52692 RepID=UPI003593AAEB
MSFVAGPITARTKATASSFVSEVLTIATILDPAVAPVVTLDKSAPAEAVFKVGGSVITTALGYEYSIDNGVTYSLITDNLKIVSTEPAYAIIYVRKAATATLLPSLPTVDLNN